MTATLDYTQPRTLQPLHTVTATEASAAPFLSIPGPASGIQNYAGYNVTVYYWSALLASGSGTLQFTTQVSYNRGASWVSGASGASITLSATAQAGEQVIPVTPNQPTDYGEVWVQVLANVGGSPTGPSAVYRADLRAR